MIKRNVLIISSEPLHPHDVLSSSFELSQAQILSETHKVAILSMKVSAVSSLFQRLSRIALKRLSANSYASHLVVSVANFFESFLQRFENVHITFRRKHTIEGIEVYEGRSIFLSASNDFDTKLRRSIATGMHVFEKASFSRGPLIIHAHGRFLLAGALALSIKKKYGIKYVYTEHSSFYRRGLAAPESLPILRDVIANAAKMTVVSRSLLRDIQDILKQSYENVLVTPNTIDKIFLAPLVRLEQSDRFQFVNIASLERIKGLDLLLMAFATAFAGNKRFHLNLCGSGSLRDELMTMRDNLGLRDQVSFLGKKTKHQIKEELDRSRVCVVSSRCETFGVVALEALVRGRPVVSFACGGPDDVITPDCGILVPAEEVSALAKALVEIASSDVTFNSARIREDTIEKYGPVAFLKRMQSIYSAVEVD